MIDGSAAYAAPAPAGPWVLTAALDGQLHKDVPDGRLIYDPLSGETRLLSPLSLFIIEMLQDARQPRDTADIVRAVHIEEPESSTLECLAAVEEALSSLCDARLVSAPGG